MNTHDKHRSPEYLIKTEKYEEAAAALKNLTFLEQAWEQNEFAVKKWWAALKEKGLPEPAAAYGDIIANPAKASISQCGIAARLLYDIGSWKESITLWDAVIARSEAENNIRGLADALWRKALIARRQTDGKPAMELLERSRALCETHHLQDILQNTLRNQGHVMYTWGRNEEAMSLYEQAMGICESIGDLQGLQQCIGSKGDILNTWGRPEEAMALLKEQERICRKIAYLTGLRVSLGDQAGILKTWGKYEEAMSLHGEEERICRDIGSLDGIQTALGSRAGILKKWGKLEEAMDLYKEKERICRAVGNKRGLNGSLLSRADILFEWGKLEEAMSLYNEALSLLIEVERICTEIGNRSSLDWARGMQAAVLINMGAHDEALPILDEVIEYRRSEKRPNSLAISLINRALCLQEKGDFVRAREDLHAALETAVELKNRFHEALVSGYLASLSNREGKTDEALELYTKQEALCRELNEPYHLCQCLADQARLLAWKKHDFEAAIPNAEEALKLAEEGNFGRLIGQSRLLLDNIRMSMVFRIH